ncbi:MAG TPA: hypothetical protein VG204_06825 [Terriglobia bacterium]|nr:hypothetical protein [Terriglobia bacterium]
MQRIEICLALLAIAIALAYPRIGARWFRMLENGFRKLARRRRLAVLVVGVTALAARAAVLPVEPIPHPIIQDEYSYLLAADTFAHGRLTNPTHPMWVHIEAFQEIWQPTYQSKYFPGQGLALALGQVVFGHPFWGVWLSIGLMCAALCWMLQGWMPPGWALLGGFLAVIRLGTFSYWADTYFGGAVAAIGGALVLGALPRIKREQHVQDALLMGLGLAILANTRPYEGLVLSLPVAAALLAWIAGRERPPWRVWFGTVALPLSLTLALAAVAMGYYFWRVTGNPLRMPYQVYTDAYGASPNLLLQHARTVFPAYHNREIRNFYVRFEASFFSLARSLHGRLLQFAALKTYELWLFFVGPLLTLPLVMLSAVALKRHACRWRLVSPGTRFLLIASAVCLGSLLLESFFSLHYAAPMTCLFLALVLLSLRRLRAWRWQGKPAGLFVSRAVPLIAVAMLLLRVAAVPLHLSIVGYWAFRLEVKPPTWCSPLKPEFPRARILAELEQKPGKHLAIVRYRPDHEPSIDWVYNEADVDASRVVWARDRGPAENEELIRYFKDRDVWLVEPDENPPRLSAH